MFVFSIAAKVEDIPFAAVNSIMWMRAPTGSNLPTKAIGMHLVLEVFERLEVLKKCSDGAVIKEAYI